LRGRAYVFLDDRRDLDLDGLDDGHLFFDLDGLDNGLFDLDGLDHLFLDFDRLDDRLRLRCWAAGSQQTDGYQQTHNCQNFLVHRNAPP